jgi:hypothetical protein
MIGFRVNPFDVEGFGVRLVDIMLSAESVPFISTFEQTNRLLLNFAR